MRPIVLLICCSLFLANAYAIIYRHDKGEAPYRQLALDSAFNCVGEVFRDYKPAATCVLVGDRYVLSAAHVFIESDAVKDTNYMYRGKIITAKDALSRTREARDSMKQIIFYVNRNEHAGAADDYSFRFRRRDYDAERIVLFPGYLDSATKGSFDLALIILKEPVPNVKPARINTLYDELDDTIVNVGFGASGDASLPEDVGFYFQRLAGTNIIDSLGGRIYNGQATKLVYDFDHPSMRQYNICGSPVALPLEHACSGGDSGGGMFRKTANGWELVGICSGTNHDIDLIMKIGYYGQSGSYTRVSPFTEWIRKEMR